MPPSTRPSISQITFFCLLEVRTPIAFSYLGKNRPLKMHPQNKNETCTIEKITKQKTRPHDCHPPKRVPSHDIPLALRPTPRCLVLRGRAPRGHPRIIPRCRAWTHPMVCLNYSFSEIRHGPAQREPVGLNSAATEVKSANWLEKDQN